MGLHPLEFSHCLTDSPYFREKLHSHEKELDRTSKAIKVLINECKDLVNAAKGKNLHFISFIAVYIIVSVKCMIQRQK